jgi:hypothetical protein
MRLNEVFQSSKKPVVTAEKSEITPTVATAPVEEAVPTTPAIETKSNRRPIYGFDDDDSVLRYLEKYNPSLYSKLDSWD